MYCRPQRVQSVHVLSTTQSRQVHVLPTAVSTISTGTLHHPATTSTSTADCNEYNQYRYSPPHSHNEYRYCQPQRVQSVHVLSTTQSRQVHVLPTAVSTISTDTLHHTVTTSTCTADSNKYNQYTYSPPLSHDKYTYCRQQ